MLLYSRDPKLKSQACHDLNRGLAQFRFDMIDKEERQEIFVALFAMLDKGCWDPAEQVNVDSIDLLVSMMKYHYTNFEKLDDEVHQKEFGQHINSIIESLMNKIGGESLHLKNYSLNALN